MFRRTRTLLKRITWQRQRFNQLRKRNAILRRKPILASEAELRRPYFTEEPAPTNPPKSIKEVKVDFAYITKRMNAHKPLNEVFRPVQLVNEAFMGLPVTQREYVVKQPKEFRGKLTNVNEKELYGENE